MDGDGFGRAARLVGRPWTLGIVRALLAGPRRFSALKASVPGVTDRVLCGRLKELEAKGIVFRRVVDAVPVRVEYGLTPKGLGLAGAIRALEAWARAWEGGFLGRDEP
jgi:DNA-binding HxlR family transcriptional regulator